MDTNTNPLFMQTPVKPSYAASLVLIQHTYRKESKLIVILQEETRIQTRWTHLTDFPYFKSEKKRVQNFPFHSKSGLLQPCQGGVHFRLLSEHESVPFLSNATFNSAFPGFLMFGLKIKAK